MGLRISTRGSHGESQLKRVKSRAISPQDLLRKDVRRDLLKQGLFRNCFPVRGGQLDAGGGGARLTSELRGRRGERRL